jgi:hypothetical protein
MGPRTVLLLLLVLVGMNMSTSQTFEGRKAFKPKPGANTSVPEIRILEPPLGANSQWLTSNRNFPIKGVAEHATGIKTVQVNGTGTRVELNGYFEYVVSLTEGVNPITVTVTSSSGNQATSKMDIIFDSAPPIVEVLAPKPSGQRGIVNVENELVALKVKAFDASGIRSVTANGNAMKAVNDTTYEGELALAEGETEISIIATDIAGKTIERRVNVRRSPAGENIQLFGKAYALIIGIDKYRGVWEPLDNAVRDARAVEDVLRNNFVFEEIRTLYNNEATREGILKALELYARKLKAEDRLMVYYSGHGDLSPQFNRGYWVPADATERSIVQYISNTDMQGLLGELPAKQVLLVADACFLGEPLRGPSATIPFQDSPTYFKSVAQTRSRRALTSGSREPVVDSGAQGHSWFAYYFLDALQIIDGKYFDALQVFDKLRVPVANNSRQTPRFDVIQGFGDAGGQFVFVRK